MLRGKRAIFCVSWFDYWSKKKTFNFVDLLFKPKLNNGKYKLFYFYFISDNTLQHYNCKKIPLRVRGRKMKNSFQPKRVRTFFSFKLKFQNRQVLTYLFVVDICLNIDWLNDYISRSTLIHLFQWDILNQVYFDSIIEQAGVSSAKLSWSWG